MKLPAMRSVLSLVVLAGLATGPAMAAGTTYRLAVDAGEYDRTNTPVCVVLQESETQANLNPVMLAEARSVKLTDADGREIPAQLTDPGLHNDAARPGVVVRELHFVLPKLEKGKSLELTAALSKEAAPGGGFAWKDTPDEHLDLTYDGRPVLRYMYLPYDDSSGDRRHDTFKVFHHVFSPTGDRIISKGPGGKYTHHRGLFFGYCHCSFEGGRADTWGCGSGHQVHVSHEGQEAGPVLGRHRVAIDWRANNKEPFVRELRELSAYHTPGGNLLEFRTLVRATEGEVKLDGNAPHAGFQFRAEQEVAEKTGGQTYYVRPDGPGEPGQARAKAFDLPWDAISFVLGDQRYTVAYLDSPENPKPAEYNERTYGRFGSYFVAEVDDQSKTLEANYRVWVQDGEMTVEEAETLSRDFVEPPEVRLH